MNIVDANVLLYAVNEASPDHETARDWLDGALNGTEAVGFSWLPLLAFLRLSTKVALFPRPLTVDDAFAVMRSWIEQPPSVIVEPTVRHLDVLAGLVAAVGTAANLSSDAHLGALAVEHHATVVTYDADFGRFPGVPWHSPRANA